MGEWTHGLTDSRMDGPTGGQMKTCKRGNTSENGGRENSPSEKDPSIKTHRKLYDHTRVCTRGRWRPRRRPPPCRPASSPLSQFPRFYRRDHKSKSGGWRASSLQTPIPGVFAEDRNSTNFFPLYSPMHGNRNGLATLISPLLLHQK